MDRIPLVGSEIYPHITDSCHKYTSVLRYQDLSHTENYCDGILICHQLIYRLKFYAHFFVLIFTPVQY